MAAQRGTAHMFTYQLHIVDHFVFVAFECFDGVSVKGEGHALQSLVLGIHADVCLHLNTPRTNFKQTQTF